MKIRLISLASIFIVGSMFVGCSSIAVTGDINNPTIPSGNIRVISREDGSGTRGAFIDLFEIEEKGENGTRKDKTTKEAIIADKTDIMITNISNDPNAIGYISLGSLDSKVKVLKIDGNEPTLFNIYNGIYKIQRPFNIAVKEDVSEATKDFIDFIMSAEGQQVVEDNKYFKINSNAPLYNGTKPSGKVTVVGSSSVAPVMEKLKEAYMENNPSCEIEIQMSDSTSGMTAAINGTCDIGMASRQLKDSEKAELSDMAIALDGIVVVVNNFNAITNLSAEEVRSIFTGKITSWSEL